MLLFLCAIVWYIFDPVRSLGLFSADKTEVGSVDSEAPFYVLLVGTDTRRGSALYTGVAGEEGQLRESADVITLVRIDPQERIVTLLTVPADTASSVDGQSIGSFMQQDNPSALIKEVETLTGVDIPYYFVTTFMGFEGLVDALGGVTVNVTTSVSMQDPATGTMVNVRSGKNKTLTGSEALAVASAWSNSGKREVVRQLQVRALERAIIQQVAQSDEATIRRILGIFEQNVSTNMESELLVSLVLSYAANEADYTLYSGSGPYQGQYVGGGDKWVVPLNMPTWSQLMATVKAGDDPNTVVRLAPQGT